VTFIVDDDPGVRSSLARLLKAEDLASRGWADAEGALTALRDSVPAPVAIVLDYRLPEMNGLRLLALLRVDRALSGVPVLIYSAFDADALRAEAHRLGVVGSFHKLTEHDDMIAALLRVARGTG
jgi:DNA-binding NarL/FixJ family response regulator